MYDQHISVKKSENKLIDNVDFNALSDEEKVKFQLGYYKPKDKVQMEQVVQEEEDENDNN